MAFGWELQRCMSQEARLSRVGFLDVDTAEKVLTNPGNGHDLNVNVL